MNENQEDLDDLVKLYFNKQANTLVVLKSLNYV